MKVNEITFNYSINNNNNKKYASRPVFKQGECASIAQKAIVDQFIESNNNKKNNKNILANKLSCLKDVLFSSETTRRVKQLQEALDSYDSNHNILYKIQYIESQKHYNKLFPLKYLI